MEETDVPDLPARPTDPSRPDPAEDAGEGASRPVLPDVSVDETSEGWGERSEDDDERYLRELPPHHLG
jgi:hypothetical protein